MTPVTKRQILATVQKMAVEAVTALRAPWERLLKWTWDPAVSMARTIVLGIFSGLEVGSMLIIDEVNGTEYAFGQPTLHGNSRKGDMKRPDSIPIAKICVKREFFWLRLLLFADIGFAESYMLEEFECDDLVSFFRVCTWPVL